MQKTLQIFVFLVIFLGIFLRVFNLKNNVIFEWDQENSVLFPAKEIAINHKFPLIGAKTGVGDLRVGPLYSYLAAIFFLPFNGHPISSYYLSFFIAISFLVFSFFLIKKVFDQPTALFFLLIWSTSTFIISFDRVPWNVNLLSLSVFFLTFAYIFIMQKKLKIGWLFAGLGIFLSINTHYSLIFLVLSLFIIFLINRNIFSKYSFFGILGLFLGIFPIIFFDFRHQHILLKNTLLFSQNQLNTNLVFIIKNIFTISGIIIETIGRLFLYAGPASIQQLLGIIILIFIIFFQNKNTKPLIILFFLNSFMYLFGFGIYKSQMPDYYFLPLLPQIALILSLSFKTQIKNTFFMIIFALIIFFNLINSYNFVAKSNPNSLQNKENIVKEIKNNTQNNLIKINYDMELGKNFGFNYLLDYYKIPISDHDKNENLYWISSPSQRMGVYPDFISGNFALAYPETVKQILSTKGVSLYNSLIKVRIPNNWTTISCVIDNSDVYLLTENSSVNCTSLTNADNGIMLLNPDCTLFIENSQAKVYEKSYLELKYIDTKPIIDKYYFLQNKTIYGLKIENNRCLNIVNMNNLNIQADDNFKLFIRSINH